MNENERQHALLSASSAHIWIHCHPSARMAEEMPHEETPWTAEGTLAHELAELKARKQYIQNSLEDYRAKLHAIRASPLYTPEMDKCTDVYAQALDEEYMRFLQRPVVGLETKVDYSKIVPGGFGTADCIMTGFGQLTVIDYKHGAGVPVSAADNPQLMLYAAGALNQYYQFYSTPVESVRLRIVQPRVSDKENVFEITTDKLAEWCNNVVKPAAEQAYKGLGECRRGEWCRFCKARAKCRQTSTDYLSLETFGQKSPNLLTDAEIGDVLTRAAGMQAWLTAVEAYAVQACLCGKDIPGHKLVAGRSVRTWTDQDAAFNALQSAGVDRAVLYDHKPCSLSELEKRLGKARFRELAGPFVHKPAGKPILAPADDPRPELMSVTTMFGGANE